VEVPSQRGEMMPPLLLKDPLCAGFSGPERPLPGRPFYWNWGQRHPCRRIPHRAAAGPPGGAPGNLHRWLRPGPASLDGLASTSGVLATILEVLASPAEGGRPVSTVLDWVRGIGRDCLRAARVRIRDRRLLSRSSSRAAPGASRGSFGQGGCIGGIGAVCPGGARERCADRAGHSPGSS